MDANTILSNINDQIKDVFKEESMQKLFQEKESEVRKKQKSKKTKSKEFERILKKQLKIQK
jgi:hypothetical protein